MSYYSQTLFKKLRSGAASIVIARFIGFFTAIATTAILARIFSVNELGTYFLMLNLVGLFSICTHFGTPNVLLRRASDAISLNQQYIIKSLLFNILSIIIFASMLFSVLISIYRKEIFEIGLNNSQVLEFLPYIIIWSIGLGIQIVSSELFRAHGKFFLAALTKSPLTGIITITSIVLLNTLSEIKFRDLILILTIAPFITSILSFLYFTLRLMDFNKAPGVIKTKFVHLIQDSIPLFIYGAGAYVGSHADIWLISIISEPRQLGLYGSAARLMILAGITLTIANGIVPPFISRFRTKKDFKGMEKMLRSIATIAAIPSLAIMLLFLLYAEAILSFVFGATYTEAANVLVILSLGQLSSVFVGSCGYVLIMYGKNNIMMLTTFVSSITSILLTFIFIDYFKIMIAVACSFTVGKILNQFLQLYFCKKICGINTSMSLFLLSNNYNE